MWTEIRHRVTWPRPRELTKSGVTIIAFVAFWAIYIGALGLLVCSRPEVAHLVGLDG